MTIKGVVKPGKIELYFNDVKVFERARNPLSSIANYQSFGLGLRGRHGAVDWIRIGDESDSTKYFEDYNNINRMATIDESFMCSSFTPCQQAFTNYFNLQKGTSYTFNQIDSIYIAAGLVLDACSMDTSLVNCDKLEKFVNEYQNQYLQPSTGYVDLDMRTFAGNKTPDEGPKGVFDVNGKLLGNTVDSTPTAVKQSYVNIWNSSADNREVGTLSLLQNGKFRLALNAGKSAPCEGIIGQRYYQFEAHTKDTLIEIRTGLGSYIDFGDSSHVFVIDSVRNAKNVILRSDTMFHHYVVKSFVGDDFVPLTRFSIAHFYNHSSSYKTYNVTIYHTDVKGFVGFGEYYKYPAPTQFSNLRGYFPQLLYDFNFTGTKDSTINTTKKIKNFKQINTIQNLELNEWAFNTPLLHINFESFANNHDLRRLTLNPYYSNLSSGVADSLGGKLFSQIVPDIKNNFPNLRYLFLDSWGERSYDLANFNFEFSKAKYIEVCWQNSYPSGFVDSLYNQVARATTLDSGRFYYGYGFGGPTNTSISEASRNYLLSRGWYLVDERSYNFGPGLTEPRDIISNDSLPFFTPFSDFINSKLNTNLTAKQVDSLYLAKCGHKPVTCPPADTSLRRDVLLCGKNEPTNPALSYEDIYDPPCSDSSILAYNSGTEIYNAYKDSLDQSFNSKYAAKCLGAASIESFTVQHPVSEYHYTLYYYDQAGNLVKTVAPAGVNPNRNGQWLTEVAEKRELGETQVPTHGMPTVYRYNSLNQVVSQKTPDAGKSTNWYDRLGRLAVSQNAQQLIDGKYSYTVYDFLGRITEVGQKPQPNAMTNAISRNPTSLFDWIYFNNGSNTYGAEMVTRTVYDEPSIDATPCIEELRFTQKSHTLRNRVSYTRYFEKPSYAYNSDWQKYFITGLSYTSGIDYSYDIHGNVDTMRNLYGSHTYSPMTHHGANACKTIAYHYDLISGKVNEVHYQPGQNDEFYHRYEYDAENRLTNVYTTDNKAFLYQQLLEEREAQYTYYKHGPLARTILGQQQVQGLDYIYNLQGWLKGINGNTKGTPQFDPGEDGKPGSLNQYIAEDVYGTTLRYFTGDYTAINSSAPNPFPAYEHKLEAGTYKPLYNGNISATTTSLGSYFTYLYNYRYDQLNRLVDMDTYRGFNATTNSWSGMDGVFYHREHYTYDANGNILRASRNGNLSANQLMDSLHYYYTPGTNRLEYIDDSATTVYGINVDIKDQSPGNYQYDAIGNLVSSVNRPISGIKWNVYGKIVDIQKTAVGNATANYIYYNYDPSGNRIGQVTRHNSGINTIYRYTWYVRDAQGNVIAVYKVADTKTVSSGTLQLAEHHMYGSSRLGIINRDIDADQPKHNADNSNNHLGEAFLINFTRGNKFFELTNHLGNVLSTITDNKLPTPVQNNPLLIASYTADLVTAVDYSPFGMTLPGRVYNNHWRRYRYGFNGKEIDNEVQGEYNELDYGMRVYDPRMGRFLSVDPLTGKYAELSPYQYASNRPIDGVDQDGLEWELSTVQLQNLQQAKITTNTAEIQAKSSPWQKAHPGESPPQIPYNPSYFLPETRTSQQYKIDQDKAKNSETLKTLFHTQQGAAFRGIASIGAAAAWEGEGILIGKAIGVASKGFQLAAHINPFRVIRFERWMQQNKLAFVTPYKELTGGLGFKSFNSFKSFFGNAEKWSMGKAWHHIVEQTPSNVARFGAENINNSKNIVLLDNGKGSIHEAISAYYSSGTSFTGKHTVREWLSTQSFSEQYKFGVDILNKVKSGQALPR